jgi:hypothetical protein
VENVQKAVVKALDTQAPAAAAFAGMHKFERGNGFGLGEHTAFGASAEGVTADEASPGGVGTGQIIDTSQRRETILKCIPVISAAMGLTILIMAQLGAYVGDMETEVLSKLRWIAVMIFYGAACGTCAWGAAKNWPLAGTSALIIFCGAKMCAIAKMSAICNTSYS